MSRFIPMLFVDDVEASSRWYQDLLGARSAHGGPEFEMLMLGDELVLQLHHADAEEHGSERLPEGAPRGAGVLLYLQTADVDAVHALHARAVEMGAAVESEPTYIELAHHTEFVVRDPDGYALAVHSPFTP
ncbi:MAG TPA: VOC family protein [Acidimicrobiales bacterium]|nr:VOC family protein [Acidimicrobiales bacterium]